MIYISQYMDVRFRIPIVRALDIIWKEFSLVTP